MSYDEVGRHQQARLGCGARTQATKKSSYLSFNQSQGRVEGAALRKSSAKSFQFPGNSPQVLLCKVPKIKEWKGKGKEERKVIFQILGNFY